MVVRCDDTQRHGDQSMELLKQAAAHGFTDAAGLARDPAFDALRQRGDFAAFLAGLAKKEPR